MRFYLKGNQQPITIADKPFAAGGEGSLYEIQGGAYGEHVAKIYHPNKRSEQRAAKIQFLLDNPPFFETSSHQPIVWVEAILCDEQRNFVGFVMKRAHGEKLEILCAPKLPKQLGSDWRRLDFEHEDALRLRAKICYNIAVAVHTVHATGKYVLVDIKPDNIVLQSNGLISIVDMDSIEVIGKDGEPLFPATVVTPDYTPPEYYAGVQPGKSRITPEWDRFGVAVIFYRLLFGIHPFAASALAPYEAYTSLGDKIQHGLFVHAPDKAQFFSVIPHLHKQFLEIDTEIQAYFIQTFVAGHNDPSQRVQVRDWGLRFYNSSLLLVDRKIPSKALSIKGNIPKDQNWYKLAMEQAVQALIPTTKVNAPHPLPKKRLAVDLSLWELAAPIYRRIGSVLGAVAKFGGIIFLIVSVFLVVVSMLTGGLSLGDALKIPVSIVATILGVMAMLVIRLPFLVLLGGVPLAIAAWRKGRNWAAQNSDSWGDHFRKTLNTKKLRRYLENKQYYLFTERTKLKHKIQELHSQRDLLVQLRQNKEQAFSQQHRQLLERSRQGIQERVQQLWEQLEACDRKARQLFAQEAQTLRQMRESFQHRLEQESPFAQITGSTVQEKKEGLAQWKKQQMGTTQEIEQAEIKLLLAFQQLQDDLERQTKEVRQQYDQLHAQLTDKARQIRQQMEQINQSAVEQFRKESRLDGLLEHPSFRKLLDMQRQLQQETATEEAMLVQLNQELGDIRAELAKYR